MTLGHVLWAYVLGIAATMIYMAVLDAGHGARERGERHVTTDPVLRAFGLSYYGALMLAALLWPVILPMTFVRRKD